MTEKHLLKTFLKTPVSFFKLNMKFLISQRIPPQLLRVRVIDEVWRKKLRQTDVVVLWGKIAAHMLLDADELIKGGQGQK